MAGRIIFLNGTSSSGKSSIAQELQKLLREPYVHMSVDGFLHGVHEWTGVPYAELPPGTLALRVSAFHQCIAALSRAGLHQIVADVFHQSDIGVQLVDNESVNVFKVVSDNLMK